jgi:PRTRC genetic system protein E
MAWRALARIVPGSAWFISGWIIAGYFANGSVRCKEFNLGSATGRSHFGEGEIKTVFTELMPLLKQRVVMITISDIGEGLLRVNVIPRKLDGSSDENGALTAPLSITGKADELDRELPGQLASFTESVTKTGSNLDELKIQHAAAVKAVEAENKKKIDDKKKGNGPKTGSAPPPAPAPTAEFKDGKPVFGTRASQVPLENGSLFDLPTSTDAGAPDEASMTPQPPQ